MTHERRLHRDRRGNVAMMAGLLAVPLLGLTGLAIDFGTATAVKAQLDLAADAAALLATTNASNAYLAGASDPITPAIAAATQSFTAQSSSLAGGSISAPAVSVHQSGTLFSSEISYQGAVPTTFGRLFGVSTIAVNGKSASSLSINPYVDIQVLMDVSSSMTIAATQVDIDRMELLTATYSPIGKVPSNISEKCAFACHWSATGGDFYDLAKKIKFRCVSMS